MIYKFIEPINFIQIMNITNSRIRTQDKMYVKFDSDGKTSIMEPDKPLEPNLSYRRVHNTKQSVKPGRLSFILGQDVFIDKQFRFDQAEVANLDPNSNQRVVLRRLYDLYKLCPKNNKPQFFPPFDYIAPRKQSSNPYLPPFATQIGIFPSQYYKSFFLTQQFTQNGMYEMIINNNGRFETDVVDDWVPVYEYSLEPIWGLHIDQAWQVILLKFWAKRNGGYNQVKSIPPFRFIEFFSNSNWKYYNLAYEGYGFFNFYTGKASLGTFILKTKDNEIVRQSGLVPNSAGYQMIELKETTSIDAPKIVVNGQQVVDPKARTWVASVKSTFVNKWTGNFSVLDKEMNNRYRPNKHYMVLDRDFMINSSDFVNLFSTVYISSNRDKDYQHYYSDYYILEFEPRIKTAIYLKFYLKFDGWLDFCIKQFDQNRVKPITQASRMRTQQENRNQGYQDNLRFLNCRYILVKKNDANSPTTFNDPDYAPPTYDTYQIEYHRGYNRGQARFLNIVKGQYILKIKPESVDQKSYFVVNYASNNKFDMNQYLPSKQESSAIMRQAMASLLGLVTSYHLDVTKKHQQIAFANVFEDIGYGFVGIRSKRSCPYRILMDVDPVEVNRSGYKIKNQFKSYKTPFSVIVNPGQTTAVVLKKIPGLTNYIWPPNGFEVFQERR